MVNAMHDVSTAFLPKAKSHIDITTAPKHKLAKLHICLQCPPGAARVFDSAKSLASHKVIKHGYRCLARMYVGDTDLCPGCHKKFVSRAGTIRHLTEKFPCVGLMADGHLDQLPFEQLKTLEPKSWQNFAEFYA